MSEAVTEELQAKADVAVVLARALLPPGTMDHVVEDVATVLVGIELDHLRSMLVRAYDERSVIERIEALERRTLVRTRE